MKYIKENKELLLKYLMIIISNIVLYILTSFYFRNYEYGSIIMFVLIVIDDYIIYNYKGTKKFKIYLDILCCFIVGLIMLFFKNDALLYSYYLFNLFFANNIVFMQSRKSEKIFNRGLQYISILLLTILCMVLNIVIYLIIFGI